MKIVIAIDSFKGSMTSMEAGYAAKKGIEKAYANAEDTPEIVVKPLVDGGEGRLDGQTANGKVPVGVARLAKQYGAKVLAFAGGVTEDALACNQAGIDAFFPIVRGVCTLDEAMDPECAKRNMTLTVEQTFRMLNC